MTGDERRGPARGSTPNLGWERALGALAAVVLVVAIATLRVVFAGESELRASTAALENGDAHEAAVRARAAALWYAPGAPHVRVAYGRLMALGAEADKRKLDDVALFSYRAVTTASTSTRWLVEPHAADAARAREAIARIEARSGERATATATEPAETIERAQLEALAVDYAPKPAWIAALSGAFLLLFGGLAWVWRRAFDETGRLDWAKARPGAIAGAIGLVAYLFTWWAA